MSENHVIYACFKADMIVWFSPRYEVKIEQHVCIQPGVNKHDFPEAVRCKIIIIPMTIEAFLADFSSLVSLVSVNREKRSKNIIIFIIECILKC